MARIGWFDARGRRLLGQAEDLEYFDNRVLGPLVTDLNKYTWLRERYGCDGLQQPNRTEYYFEYPALVSMLTKDVRYGIELSVGAGAKVSVAPFRVAAGQAPATPFEYHLGNIDVSFNPTERVTISAPADTAACATQFEVKGLVPEATYSVSVAAACGCSAADVPATVAADSTGYVAFVAPGGAAPCVTTLTFVN